MSHRGFKTNVDSQISVFTVPHDPGDSAERAFLELVQHRQLREQTVVPHTLVP